ncbi:hypothetical protein BCR44DRAFT_114976, partial [Catenaria anguillulae PL171]
SARSPKRSKHLSDADVDREPTAIDYDRLTSWLLRHGADLSSICIRRSATSEGFGIYASRTIPADSQVAFLPAHLILSEHDALASPLGQSFLAFNKTVELGEYAERHVCTKTILWLFVVQQFFVQREEGKWWPYLRALPRAFDTPLFWTAEERDWLRGTNLYFVIKEKEEELRRDFLAASEVLKSQFPQVWGDDHHLKYLTLENYLWARTVCSSRAFPSDLDLVVQGRTTAAAKGDSGGVGKDDTHDRLGEVTAEDGSIPPCKCHLALWPMFDMLNHRRGQSMTWDATRADGVAFITGVPMEAGEEVFNSYGPKGNDELLLSYGFCLDIPSNPDDYFPIKLNFAADPLHAEKLDLLTRHALLPYKHLYLLRHADPIPANLVAAMRILVATQPELASMVAEQVNPTTSPLSTRNELVLLDTLVSLLNAKRAAISESNDPSAAGASASFRARMAGIYRRGQAAILDAALLAARERLADHVAQVMQSGGAISMQDVAGDEEFWADEMVEQLADVAEEQEWGHEEWVALWVVY